MRKVLLRLEDGINYARVAPIDQLEFSLLKDSMGSVRNDNDEKELCTTIKLQGLMLM